jgi:hypothetical protein
VTLLSSTALYGSLSEDGSRAIVVELNATGQWAIRVVNIDATDPVVLVPSAVYSTGCFAFASFAGPRNDRVAAAWCAPDDNHGVLHAFTLGPSSVDDRPLSSNRMVGAGFAIDDQGSFAATLEPGPESTQQLGVYDLSAGTGTIVADGVTDIEFSELAQPRLGPGFFLGGGAAEAIAYVTPYAFDRQSLGQPGPIVLASGSFVGALPSPDGAHAFLATPQALMLASTVTPSPPVPLTVFPFLGGFSGLAAWTRDGSRAYWLEMIGDGGASAALGGVFDVALAAVSVAGGAPGVIDTDSPLPIGSPSPEKVVGLAYFASQKNELRAYDLAKVPAARTTLATAVDDNVAITPDGCSLVYTTTVDFDPKSPRNGLWIVPVP